RQVWLEAQALPRRLPVAAEELAPHGVTGDLGLARGHCRQRWLVRDRDARRDLRQRLHRQPRLDVGQKQQQWRLLQAGGEPDTGAAVAAGGENDVGPEAMEDAGCLRRPRRQAEAAECRPAYRANPQRPRFDRLERDVFSPDELSVD